MPLAADKRRSAFLWSSDSFRKATPRRPATSVNDRATATLSANLERARIIVAEENRRMATGENLLL